MKAPQIPEFKLLQEGEHDASILVDLLEKHSGYDPMLPHRHNGYEIFLFEEGGGLHMVDFKEMEIMAHQVHVLCPGQVHYMHRAPASKGVVLKFTADFLLSEAFTQTSHSFFKELSEPCLELNKDDFLKLRAFVNVIEQELKQGSAGSYEMVLSYLNLFVLHCKRLQAPLLDLNSKWPEQHYMQQFKTLLEVHFVQEHSVSFYASAMSLSQDKLTTVTKRSLGKTASEFIADRLLLEAKRWLLHSNKSLKEIAFELNFQDQAYFSRWCKKMTSATPGDVRAQLRDKYKG